MLTNCLGFYLCVGSFGFQFIECLINVMIVGDRVWLHLEGGWGCLMVGGVMKVELRRVGGGRQSDGIAVLDLHA